MALSVVTIPHGCRIRSLPVAHCGRKRAQPLICLLFSKEHAVRKSEGVRVRHSGAPKTRRPAEAISQPRCRTSLLETAVSVVLFLRQILLEIRYSLCPFSKLARPLLNLPLNNVQARECVCPHVSHGLCYSVMTCSLVHGICDWMGRMERA